MDPDIIGIQETKVNDPDFPVDEIREIGYHPEYWRQKGHYGEAILSKKNPIEVQKGFIKDTVEDQKRFIQAKFKWGKESITIMNFLKNPNVVVTIHLRESVDRSLECYMIDLNIRCCSDFWFNTHFSHYCLLEFQVEGAA